MQANLRSYRIRPLPLTRKPTALLSPHVVDELRLICGGHWDWLYGALLEQRMDAEDRGVAL